MPIIESISTAAAPHTSVHDTASTYPQQPDTSDERMDMTTARGIRDHGVGFTDEFKRDDVDLVVRTEGAGAEEGRATWLGALRQPGWS